MKSALALALTTLVLCACGKPLRGFLGEGGDGGGGVGSGATLVLVYDSAVFHGGPDDARQNSSALLQNQTQFKSYLATDPQRAAKIAKITTEVSLIVAGYNIVVTGTPPATGPYFMIVVTDDDGRAASCATCISAAVPACDRATANRNAVGFVFGGVLGGGEMPIHMVTANIVAMLGMFEAIPTSTKVGDCMCYRDTPCIQDWQTTTTQCTIGGAQTPLSTVQSCPTSDATMDESAEFIAAFGFG